MLARGNFLTVEEAAEIYDVHGHYLKTLLRVGGVKPAYKCMIGQQPEQSYFSKEEIERVLKGFDNE